MAAQESLLLGYMPHRDDFEDFDKTVEGLVSQIGDKSVQDEDVDIALKLGGSFYVVNISVGWGSGMVLGLLDPDLLVRGTDPDPDPSIIKQKW